MILRPSTVQVASRLAYQNPWMRVREDRVIHMDGEPGLYGLVEKPDFSLIVPRHHERICLIEHYRYPVDGWYLEFPQGSVGVTDQVLSPAATARQELLEETGIVARELEALGSLHEAYGYATSRCHIFTAAVEEVGDPAPEASEGLLSSVWITVDEFWRLVSIGKVSDGPTIAAMALFERWRANGQRKPVAQSPQGTQEEG